MTKCPRCLKQSFQEDLVDAYCKHCSNYTKVLWCQSQDCGYTLCQPCHKGQTKLPPNPHDVARQLRPRPPQAPPGTPPTPGAIAEDEG